MEDLDNVSLVPLGDTVISVADVWLQAHAGIVMLRQEHESAGVVKSAGFILLSEAAMDSLCSAWMRYRIGVKDPAA